MLGFHKDPSAPNFRRWQHDLLKICVVAQEGQVFFKNNYAAYRGKIWNYFGLKGSKLPKLPIHGIGILSKLNIINKPQEVPHSWFTGSPANPHKTWYLRIGRLVIMGDSPDRVLKAIAEIKYRINLLGAKLADGEYLCDACGNGLVEHHHGFPGEYFDICRNCGHEHGYEFRRSEIE